MKEAIKVWIRNEKEIEEAIINGEETHLIESDFGASELVIDFLKESGLWDILTTMPIRMGKNNGYCGNVILGILILKELMAIGKIAGAGKIIKDGKLMADIGFNIEKIKKAEKEDKGVIDLDTLRNHLKKISQTESDKAFYQHIKILRDKRWIRGQEYVADAVELEVPYGETFEGMGEVWKKKEERYKYGYKLELLMNVTTTGRLRFVGCALAPINSDERALLISIFEKIEKVNCVVTYDEYKGRIRRRIYVTTLDAKADPFKIYKLYKDRWTIENQGIRYLSQRWSLKDFAGKSLNSIQARILTVLTLYNAVKILEMKYEDKMEKLKEKMREKGERSYLSGCALIVYGRDKYYGIFSGVNYANLVAERTAKSTTKKRNKEIAEELEKMLLEKASKKKIGEFIKRLKQE